MNLIKKIIAWILSLIASLFKKKKKVVKKKTSIFEEEQSKNKKKDKLTSINGVPDTTLPSYMIISDQDKLELIKNILEIKKHLLEDNDIKEKSIEKIIEVLKENVDSDYSFSNLQKYLEKQDFSKLSPHKVRTLLESCDDITKEKINEIIEDSNTALKALNESINNLDEVVQYIDENDISFATKDLINDQVLSNEEIPIYDKDILNTIKTWDKCIVDKAKLEYDVVNYVTLSNVMIDDIIEEYNKIMDDYQHRRYNKFYYEEKLGRIKEQINYLEKIKNSSVVYTEIERLRNELYTKSKDKYDILYNNEIFIDIDKRCDELLGKVNQKVVDIKKEETKDEDREKREQEEYWRKILLRFQDLSLSQRIILLHQEMKLGRIDYEHANKYISWVYQEFLKGVDGPFNYERNRVKTELVNLYNDLNGLISKRDNMPYIMVNHINFRMEDLVDAVAVKKDEVERSLKLRELNISEQVDEKLDDIRTMYIDKKERKVFSKDSRKTA